MKIKEVIDTDHDIKLATVDREAPTVYLVWLQKAVHTPLTEQNSLASSPNYCNTNIVAE